MSITADLPNIRVRLDPEIHKAMQKLARMNERTLSAEVRFAVMQYLALVGYEFENRK